MHDASIDLLARALTRRDALMRVPAQPLLTLRQAVISGAVNTGASTCSVVLSGGSTVIPGVTFIQSYGPAFAPAAGHTCWVHVNGNDLIVIGKHT